MSSQLQYKPVSTSCMNVYNNLVGELPTNSLPFFVIRHPDGRSMKLGNNNMIHLNEGSEVNFQKYRGNDVYKSQDDNIAFFKDGDSSYSLRHTGYVLYLHPFNANNYDFAWYLEPDGDGYNIYNNFGGGMYIGYDQDNDQLRIGSQGNKITWQIEEHGGNDSKLLKKALSYMNKGQGQYNDVFEGVDACVFPKETLKLMNFDKQCKLKNSDTNDIVNNNFIQSIGGVMNQDREIANNDILVGKGLYPSNGCGIITNTNGVFKESVADSGVVIDFENQKILRQLREKIRILKLEIKDLSQVQVPNQRRILAAAIQRYEGVLADCNYHKWLKPWLIEYGLPWIKQVIEQNRGYLYWLDNYYWPAVNNYGRWLSDMVRRALSRPLFFEHCGYGGAVGHVDPGNSVSSLCCGWNDKISSIKVPPGVRVTVYEDNNFRGQNMTVTNNIDCLVNNRYGGRGGNWNDQISSIRVDGQLDPSTYRFNMNR